MLVAGRAVEVAQHVDDAVPDRTAHERLEEPRLYPLRDNIVRDALRSGVRSRHDLVLIEHDAADARRLSPCFDAKPSLMLLEKIINAVDCILRHT